MPASDLTPSERSQRSRMAAHASWANTPDVLARTKAGRDGFLGRFADQVDPERKLSEAERQRRAESAKKAYMAGLALKSAKARRLRKTAGDA